MKTRIDESDRNRTIEPVPAARGRFLWPGAAAAACLSIATLGICSELRPYNVPIQQSPPIRQYEQRPQVDETVYAKFRNDIKRLNQKQKNRLERSFSTKLDKALKSGNLEEARYYQNLITILKEK